MFSSTAATVASIPTLQVENGVPTIASCVDTLAQLACADGKVVAVHPRLLNAIADARGFPYRFDDPACALRGPENVCRSRYHTGRFDQRALWRRRLCRRCESLEYEWDRSTWPYLARLAARTSRPFAAAVEAAVGGTARNVLLTVLVSRKPVVEPEALDQLSLRLGGLGATARSLVGLMGPAAANDLDAVRRMRGFENLRPHLATLVARGWIPAPAMASRRGRVVGSLLHRSDAVVYTALYRKIIEFALVSPFTLVRATPCREPHSAECATLTTVWERLSLGLPILGSPTLCVAGRLTDVDTRGTIFSDLRHCAKLNADAVLAPVCALHFSADPALQPQLECERGLEWQPTVPESPGVAAVRAALHATASRRKRRRENTGPASTTKWPGC